MVKQPIFCLKKKKKCANNISRAISSALLGAIGVVASSTAPLVAMLLAQLVGLLALWRHQQRHRWRSRPLVVKADAGD